MLNGITNLTHVRDLQFKASLKENGIVYGSLLVIGAIIMTVIAAKNGLGLCVTRVVGEVGQRDRERIPACR